jgi:glycosyltransferase involved in cell wall biosynthesis
MSATDGGARTRPLHVGLDLMFLVPNATGGMEVVARELLSALAELQEPNLRLTAFINRDTARTGGGPWGKLIDSVTVPATVGNRLKLALAVQTVLPASARRAGVDVLHSLANMGPLHGRFRRVVTVHDLIYARFQESHVWLHDKGVRVLVPATARRADRIITVSKSSRDDLVALTGLDPDRIDVIAPGLGRTRTASPRSARELRADLRLGERRPLLLSLSAKRPHKNLGVLIEALAAIEPERRPLLILPGYPTWHEPELRRQASSAGVDGDIRFLGWLSDADIDGLFEIAAGFVLPSLYEGFGLPVLESMARGVPVACSDIPPLRESAGGAALMFDPRDATAIAQALTRLLTDQPLRERLIALGRKRAREFTWERAARATVASYRRVMGGR